MHIHYLQPKYDMAQYVGSHGIPIPATYPTFKAVRRARRVFYARSEHPQDLAGASDIVRTHQISVKSLKEARAYTIGRNDLPQKWEGTAAETQHWYNHALKDMLAGRSDERTFHRDLARISQTSIQAYCRLMGIEEAAFLDQLSYSYWQVLGGTNHAVIADSGVQGRYHLMTNGGIDQHNYSVIQDGHIIQRYGQPITALEKGVSNFIAFYEKVRTLPDLNPNHCPLIECQLFKGVIYFLQYHRTRDFNPAPPITRQPEADEITARFVRGTTPPEGTILQMTLAHPWHLHHLFTDEEAGVRITTSRIFGELMHRIWQAELIQVQDERRFEGFMDSVGLGHAGRSQLFKPGVSLVIDMAAHPAFEKFLSATRRHAWDTDQRVITPVRILSDGVKAYLKFLEGFPA